MVQIYVKYKDGNFYLLDLKQGESVNLKTTVKELNDITKIFSPFTQSFKIPATDKNKILFGFYGNEKIQGNSSRDFDCNIYVGGFIFESGKLSVEEIAGDEYKADFGSTVSGLVDKIGDATIQDAFLPYDDKLKIVWNVNTLRSGLQTISNLTLSNGLDFSWGIPFISNNRVLLSSGTVDNISYNQTRNNTNENFIKLSEVRPAVTYLTILKQLILKYDLNVICPLFEKTELKELFAYCTNEKFVIPEQSFFRLENYLALVYDRFDKLENTISGYRLPGESETKWLINLTQASGVFTVSRNPNQYFDGRNNWGDGFDIFVEIKNLVSLENTTPSVKVNIRDAVSNTLYNSITIENTERTVAFRFLDSLLNSKGSVQYYVEILPQNLVTWSSIDVENVQNYRKDVDRWFGKAVQRAKYRLTAENKTLSTNLGGNKINLISLLPKIKAIDFLRSFFKTFNISIIPTGLEDNSMYWLTPENIKEINQPYSKRIVTYDNGELGSKKKANDFNQYIFAHKESKYYESVYGDGTRFGSLTYPSITPAKPRKYEVKTDYSILKQSNTFLNGIVRTCLAFELEGATVEDNGAIRYKPVYDEFTLMYLKQKSLNGLPVGSEASKNSNYQINSLLEANFVNYTNGKTLAFGGENGLNDSLYLNYYKDFIELLLDGNTYKSEFTLTLPPNEIFLNFANTNQNESNIPTGFRAQNEIIIGEQRYQLVDSTIDLTTGKTKLTLLNF